MLAVGIVLAVVALRSRLPSPASTWAALRQAEPGWLLAAVVLAVVSMAAFAEQQRHLLAAFGVRMPRAVSLAVSYTGSAMATALPGGSAVSAGYVFRQFRARGASQPIAAAVMLLSGVASVSGLALLYAGDALTWMSQPYRSLAVLVVLAATVAWAVHRDRAVRRAMAAVAVPASSPGPEWPTDTSVLRRLRRTLHETITLARAVSARQWASVVAIAVANWLTDLAGLLAALQAVGLTVPARIVVTAYLAAQLIRQIPVTPGGLGVIEASLILALTTAGAAQAPATAAVLVYRLLSCWMILPIGLICWTAQRTPSPPTEPRRAFVPSM
jgi:uncharacterized protein (TIRG00374 family)